MADSSGLDDLLGVRVDHCRDRQRRLLEEMARQKIDLVIVTRIEHVQWLADPRFMWYHSPCAALAADGRLTLVAPDVAPPVAAADEVVAYASKRLSTLRNDQAQASAEALHRALAGKSSPRRLGVEFSVCGPHFIAGSSAELVDIEPDLYRLRRRKHADELARIRKAISATVAMYARAREIIEPGVTEIEVFNELQAAAVEVFGEMMTGTGNDYAVEGRRGGPPLGGRKAHAGQLYILDLGPAYRGYFADNCRTFAVDRRPTQAQLAAWQMLQPVFAHVERTVRPGVSCKQLYEEAKAMVANTRGWEFPHHLGHGIGLFPHEAPHLNPNWDDTFAEGEVFAVEPGLYAAELNLGLRIENNYLVTAGGVELLSPIPHEL